MTMEIALAVATSVVLLGIWWSHRALAERLDDLEVKTDRLERLQRARQGQAKQKYTSRRNPAVDGRAKTSSRDTDDLLRTGRMGKVITTATRGGTTSDGI